MEINEGVLRDFRAPVERALEGYAQAYRGLSFQEFEEFQLTPEKGYTAKTKVPVSYRGQKAGDMYIILFRPGDGTGAESEEYNLESLTPSLELSDLTPDRRIVPRSKEGTIAEGYFPLITMVGEDKTPYAGQLMGLGVDFKKEITKGFALGQMPLNFYGSLGPRGAKVVPRVQLTTGYDLGGRRFGDPHAIVNMTSDSDQIAGFLAITDENNPLMELSKSWKIPFQFLS